jgi:haloacid dehalogenase superfamily, subfamily IA, variant 3 with third motif having DD or ED/haloacid dehalogenase superfamily, subfamily IA, variant 1 with third motif having Dx(3-4)D or Dx(3-4)E
MDIKTVIFDLDGTLIDSMNDIVNAVNITLGNFNLPLLPKEVIGSYVGEGMELLIKRSIGEKNLSSFDEVLSFYVKTYNAECRKSTYLFPGVEKVLAKLKEKGIKIALATNKSIGFSEQILKELDIYKYFDVVMGPESVKNKKPNPDVVYKILETVNTELSSALFVGDSKFDIICGKNAGILTCGVTYGIGSVQSLIDSNADFLICDIEKLLLFI